MKLEHFECYLILFYVFTGDILKYLMKCNIQDIKDTNSIVNRVIALLPKLKIQDWNLPLPIN